MFISLPESNYFQKFEVMRIIISSANVEFNAKRMGKPRRYKLAISKAMIELGRNPDRFFNLAVLALIQISNRSLLNSFQSTRRCSDLTPD